MLVTGCSSFISKGSLMCRLALSRLAAQSHRMGNRVGCLARLVRPRLLPRLLAVCLGAFVALGGAAALGATFSWDPSGGSASLGGAGNWSTGTTNWWNGTTTAAWAAGNTALFSGSAGGTVTLTNSQSVAGLTFSTTGYTLTGSTLTLTGGSITANQSAQMNNVITGTAGLTLTGTGRLVLASSVANAYSGPVVVNGGTLTTAAPNVANSTLGTASSITVNNGGTIVVGLANTGANSIIGSSGVATKQIRINQGGLVTTLFPLTNHLNQLLLDGGTLSATGGTTGDANWNFDGGVLTGSDGRTSYILGGNLALTSSATSGGTQINVGTGDTLNVTTIIGLAPGLTAASQFGLVKTGSGILDLTASNTYSKGTTINGGTLNILGDFNLGTGTGGVTFGGNATLQAGASSIVLGSARTVTINSGDIATFDTQGFGMSIAGSITGAGGLTATGSSALTLNASDTYTGVTLVKSGTLLLANANALAGSTFDVSGTGALNVGGVTAIGFGGLQGAASGSLSLINSGGTPINLSVGSNNANTTLTGLLTGGGSLTKVGTGTLTLAGTNNYTGLTSINGGVLSLTNSAALPSGGTISFGGGTLQFSAANTFDYSPQFSTAASQPYSINTNNQSVTFAGNLSSPSGTLTKLGAGQLTLSGSNNGSLSTVTINGGTLVFANSNAVPFPYSGGGQIIINPGGVLSAISGDANTVNGWLNTGDIATGSGGAIALTTSSSDPGVDFTSGPGYPTLALGAVGKVTYSGSINPYSAGTGYFLGSSGTLVLTGPLTDAGSSTPLTVVSGGAVIIANSNSSWSGVTTIQSGATLQLGDGTTNTILPANSISNSGTLTFLNASAGTVSTPITGTGVVNAPGSAPLVLNGNITAGTFLSSGTSALTVGGTNNFGTLEAFGTSVQTFNGNTTSGIFYANGGTVNFSGNLSTTGKTVFGTNLGAAPHNAGVVNWSGTGSINPVTGGGFFGIADSGQTETLNINGGSLAIANNTATAEGAVFFLGNGNSGAPANGILNMNAGVMSVGSSAVFDIGGISPGGTVTPTGTGILNISGGSMYIAQGFDFGTGSDDAITMAWGNNSAAIINVTGGTLSTARSFIFGGGTASSATLNLNGGVLELGGVNSTGQWFVGVSVVAGTNGAFIYVPAGQFAKNLAGTPISGAGTLTAMGAGALYLIGTGNTYQGGTVINGGVIGATNDSSLGQVPSSFVANNITFNGGELVSLSSSINLTLSANRGIFLGANGGVLSAGSASANGVIPTGSGALTVNGVISGGGPLTIANYGPVTAPSSFVNLANPANTYTGNTTIGTPQLGGFFDFGAFATLNVPKLANGGLPSSIGQSANAAANLSFNPGSGGTATLSYTGTGDSTDRLFTITSGTNTVINSSGTGPVNFTNTGAIAFGNTQTQNSTLVLGGAYSGATPNTFTPQITDNGPFPTGVTVNGSYWSLTGGSNTYSGATSVTAGTLQLTSSLPNSTVGAYAGSKLSFAAGATSGTLGGLSGNSTNIALQDANSSAVTLYVGNNNTNTTFAGNLSGPGILDKTGNGMLTLSGTQSYTGGTTVNGGTLQIAPPSIGGFGGNGAGWALKSTVAAGTTVGANGNVLTLTQTNLGNTATALWYNTPLPLTGTPWTATFTYNALFGGGADGTAFVLQTSTSGASALGPGVGGTFGYSGIQPSVGMTLQIFNSSEINLVTSPSAGKSLENIGTNTLPFGVNLRAVNTPVNFTITYDGSSTMTLSATQGASVLPTQNFSTGSLATTLTGMNGYAYVGFVGGDGATTSTQLISNFNLMTAPVGSLNVLPANAPLVVNGGGVLDLEGGTQAVGDLSGAGVVTNYNTGLYSATALLTLGSDNTNQTFSGTISGPLAVTKVGSGTQTFSGVNTYTGPTNVNGGALMYPTTGALPTGGAINVNLGGGLIAQGAYPTVNQWLGSGAINNTSSGAILLTSNNSDGDVNFSGYNTLSLGALGGVTYGGSIEPGTGGYYLGGGGGTLTVTTGLNDQGGPTALTINGPGMVVLTVTPSYSGNTTVNTGSVLDLGGNTLTTAATVVINGVLQNGTVNSTVSDYIIQSGYVSANLGGGVNLFKTTAGTATLAGANSYTGVTNINGGLLNLGSAGAIPAGGTISFGGGTMQFSLSNTTDYSGQILSSTGAISIDPNGQSVTFATALAASNTAGLTLNGSGGTLNLSAIELYTGTTTVNGSYLALTGGSNSLSTTDNLVVTGGTLDLGGNGQTTSGTVSFQGGVVQNGTITNNTVTYDGQAGTVNASLAGSVGLNKTTAGVLTLNGASSFSGSTTLSAGILVLGNTAALGSSGTLSLNGGTLESNTTLSGVPNPVIVQGNMTLGGTNSYTLSGSFTNFGGNHTLPFNDPGAVITISGNIYMSESQGTGRSLSFNSGVNNTALVLSGNISDSSLGATSGTAGTLTIQPNNAGDTVLISGSNTYTGSTSLGGNAVGIITIGTSAAFGASSVVLDKTQVATTTPVTLNNNFTTAGTNPTIDTFSGSSILTIDGSFTNSGESVTYTTSGAESVTFNGPLTNSGTNATFNNIGSGVETFAGNVFLSESSTASRTLTLGGSGTTVLSGQVANFNGSGGTGNLTFNGAGGILDITGTNNTYTGVTDISAGTVNVGSLSNYGSNSSLGNRAAASETTAGDGIGIHIGVGTTGATLQYTGSTAQSTNRQIRLSAANNTIDASGSVPAATMSFTYSETNTNLYDTGGTRSLTLTGSNTGLNLFAINIQNQGTSATSLIKSGVGTWVVTNSANGLAITGADGIFSGFSGGTTINAGMLIAQAPGAIGEVGSALKLAGGTLDLQTDTSINSLNTTVSGNATIVADRLTPSSAGITQTLGTLNIGNETLSIAQGANVSGGAPGVAFSGATTLTGSAATFSPAAGTTLTLGNVGDGGAGNGLTLAGNGELVLDGTDTYGGPTVVESGSLIAATSTSLPSGGALIVGAGAAGLGLDLPLAQFAAAGGNSAVSSQSASAVPEPGTLALLAAAALAGLAALRAKKRSRAGFPA